MLKQRIFSVIAGVVLLLAATGATGIVVDTMGFFVTSQAFA